MRVWILEDMPEDYEPRTRHGVYYSPVVAWDDFFTLVEKSVFKASVDEFTLYVGADRSAVDQADPKRDTLVMVRYGIAFDEIHLSGVHIKGTNSDAPTRKEWRDLQHVAGLLRQHAVQMTGFVCVDAPPNHSTGHWNFRREND